MDQPSLAEFLGSTPAPASTPPIPAPAPAAVVVATPPQASTTAPAPQSTAKTQPSLAEFLGSTPAPAPQSTAKTQPSLAEFLGTSSPQTVLPEQTHIDPQAGEDGLRQAAKAWGLNPDLIAKSSVYNFKDANKDNSTSLGYNSDFIDTLAHVAGVGQNFNQGAVNFAQDLGNKVATIWRDPSDQEGAKFATMLRQSNFTQRQMKGEDVDPITGAYDKPLSQSAGYMAGGLLASGPLAEAAGPYVAGALGGGKLVAGGGEALLVDPGVLMDGVVRNAVGDEVAGAVGDAAGASKFLPGVASNAAQGAIYGGVGDPNHPVEGAISGALVGGALPVVGAGLGVAGEKIGQKLAGALIPNPEEAKEVVRMAGVLDLDKMVGLSEVSPQLGKLQDWTGHTTVLDTLTGAGKSIKEKAALAKTLPDKLIHVFDRPEKYGWEQGNWVDWANEASRNPTTGEIDLSVLGKKYIDFAKDLEDAGAVNTLDPRERLTGLDSILARGVGKLIQTAAIPLEKSAAKETKLDGAVNIGVLFELMNHSVITDTLGVVVLGKVINTMMNNPSMRNKLIEMSVANSKAAKYSIMKRMGDDMSAFAARNAKDPISGLWIKALENASGENDPTQAQGNPGNIPQSTPVANSEPAAQEQPHDMYDGLIEYAHDHPNEDFGKALDFALKKANIKPTR